MIAPVVILLVRAPVLGTVKTRLAETVGHEGALALHTAFAEDTGSLIAQAGFPLHVIHTDGPAPVPAHHRAFTDRQHGDTFAARFDHAFQRARARHPQAPLLMLGVDTPHLPVPVLREAVRGMLDHDAIIGPGTRDGFWTLGFRDTTVPVADALQSAAEVSDVTRTLTQAGLRVGQAPPFYDLDTIVDIERLVTDVNNGLLLAPPRTMAVLDRLGIASLTQTAVVSSRRTPQRPPGSPPSAPTR